MTIQPPGRQALSPQVARWCEEHLGSPAEEVLLHAHHLTEAVGVRLTDGRTAMVKIRGASPRIAGCAVVQGLLHERGVPCPALLAGPAPLSAEAGSPLVTAEEWLPGGEIWLGENAPARYAELFAQLVLAAPAVEEVPALEPPVPWLHYDHGYSGRIWPPPASDRWDPHRIESALPPQVVQVAVRARRRLLAPDARGLPRIVAHGDYEAQNTRWFADDGAPDGLRPVVFDWDSVVALPEAVVLGNAAAGFVSPDQPDLATLAQTDQFLEAYRRARGRQLSAVELQVVAAAGLWVAAYNAAFEHLKGGPGPVTRQLALQAEERLARAGA